MVEVAHLVHGEEHVQQVSAKKVIVYPSDGRRQGCCIAYSVIRSDKHGLAQY